MPFFVLNAVLAIVSIVGGLTLYHELQTTRATLAIVEQQNAECEANCSALVRNWHLCCESHLELQKLRDRQFKQIQGFRTILTRHRIEWHEEPGIVLEIAP